MKTTTSGEVVVVTGASGCLGHATLRLLISRDPQVTEIRCLDLVAPSRLKQQEIEEELQKLETQVGAGGGSEVRAKRVRRITGDIRDINVVERALRNADCVIHCAARVDFWVEVGEQRAQELESVNVQGTETLLRACVRLGVAKFVHASSFEVFTSYHTIYYATESTIPDPQRLLFGPSAATKKEAEAKVRQYANVKLEAIERPATGSGDAARPPALRDALNAVIVRFTPIYGEHDAHYVTKILRLAKLFGGKLQRFTNIWIRQQPIYVGNAAWALVRAKQRMDVDASISGEEFHITDETPIGDPFDFMEPFAECCGMKVTKSTFSAWPVWLFLVLFTFVRNLLATLDVFGLFTSRKSRLDEAIELEKKNKEQRERGQRPSSCVGGGAESDDLIRDEPTECQVDGTKCEASARWYSMITPQAFYFMCNSLFLNRTKASLRLDYEPIFTAEQSLERSLDWYRSQLKL